MGSKNNHPKSINEMLEEINETADEIISSSHEIIDKITKRLNKIEERYLEYFWNSKRNEIRKSIPEEIIVFFEKEKFHESVHESTILRVQSIMSELEIKGYISKRIDEKKMTHYQLTINGMQCLKDKHPTLFVFFERLSEKTPVIVKLLVGLIGLIASIFCIFQFINDIILKK